jgi:hypothetical protein
MKKILSTAVILLASSSLVVAIVLVSGWNIEACAETNTAPVFLEQEATPIDKKIDDATSPVTYDAGINDYLLIVALCTVGLIWASIVILKERKRLEQERSKVTLKGVSRGKKV